MATSNKGTDNTAAEPNTDTPSAQSAMTKYRKPLTIAAIVAGGALALGAAFTGGVAVAQLERPHFGNEAMGAPQGDERGERGEQAERGEGGEHRGHGPRGDADQQRPGGPGEQRHMGGQPGDSNTPAPTPTP